MSESKIDALLKEKGIVLPEPSVPGGNFVPYVVSGSLVFIAGQAPRRDGKLEYLGKVGKDLSVEEGQKAARLCMLNILCHLKTACGGNLDRVARAVRLAGLVNCGPDFTEHPKVTNGASDLLVELFGEKGKHARISTGASSLPSNMAVEIEAVFEISR